MALTHSFLSDFLQSELIGHQPGILLFESCVRALCKSLERILYCFISLRWPVGTGTFLMSPLVRGGRLWRSLTPEEDMEAQKS